MNTDAVKAINEVVEEVHRTGIDKGFWRPIIHREEALDRLSSKIALVHSELSEALEELRHNTEFEPDPKTGSPKIAMELADATIRIFDLAGHLGVDLGDAIYRKNEYNKTRERKHGKEF